MSNEVTVCNNFIQELEPEFNKITVANNCDIKFQQEAQFALQLLTNNDFLRRVAMENSVSLKNAVLNVGAIGLTLNPIEKKAYLIPRRVNRIMQICLDISYIGLVDVACQLGSIKFVQAKVVYKKDSFDYNGVSSEPTHNFNAFGDRGEKVGVYCVAKTNDGDFLTETMTLEECHEIRNRSESWKSKKGPQGPWLTDENEMMKKTVIKRASKLWPKTDKTIRLETAIAALNEHEGINFDGENTSDEEKREAREKQLKLEREAKERKHEMIEEIIGLSAKICENKTQPEKIQFMQEVLQVQKFDDFKNKSNEKIEQILENLKDMQ